jgi:hypothetical protein
LMDDATQASTSSASHANQPVGTGYSLVSSNSLYLAARIRQRRNDRRATGSLPAFQMPGEPSAETAELSDAYLQSLVQLYSESKKT